MPRQKILRVKATFEAPFSNVREGGELYMKLKDVVDSRLSIANLSDIAGLDMKWGEIEETTRAAPSPVAEVERLVPRAAE